MAKKTANVRSGYIMKLNADETIFTEQELNEDPGQTVVRIESLRKAVVTLPHLTSPTDDGFLLMFLRHAKFSESQALKEIDDFIELRAATPSKELFVNSSQLDSLVQKCFEEGAIIILPTLPASGKRTFLFRSGRYDPRLMTFRDACRAAEVAVEMILQQDPVSQVKGIQYVIDESGAGLKHYSHAFNPTTAQMIASTFLDGLPCQMHGLHFCRAPFIVRAIVTVLKKFSSKADTRVYIHSSDASLHNAVDKSILPSELGGDAGTYEDLAAQSNAFMMQHSGFFGKYSSVAYDETKKAAKETI